MRSARGITLIEVVIATVIITVSAVGALSYEYHAARQTRYAFARSRAVHIGYFLLEDWKANGGSAQYAAGITGIYNPVDSRIGADITYIGSGVYEVTVDDIPMEIELERPASNVGFSGLIPITATVQWRNDFSNGKFSKNDPSVVLNTYARIGQVSG